MSVITLPPEYSNGISVCSSLPSSEKIRITTPQAPTVRGTEAVSMTRSWRASAPMNGLSRPSALRQVRAMSGGGIRLFSFGSMAHPVTFLLFCLRLRSPVPQDCGYARCDRRIPSPRGRRQNDRPLRCS